MSKVTSKLQVTLPKSIATRFSIKPGDELQWEAAGETIRVVPLGKVKKSSTLPEDRLRLFDKATERQQEREKSLDPATLSASANSGRGWTRSDVYDRGSPG
jgi:AbrB family looped-hinge helix DNA binding protein